MFDIGMVGEGDEAAEGAPSSTASPAKGADTIAELRAKMAAIPSRVGAVESQCPPDPGTTPTADIATRLTGQLGQVLPGGGMEAGTVLECSGSRYLLLGLLAAVTETGRWAAVLGTPGLGLLAVAELGGRLDRLAHIRDPGPDPVATAAVLLDGIGLVVLDAPGSATPARTRAVVSRVRSQQAVLIVTSPGAISADVKLQAQVTGYTGLGEGRGRVREIHLDVQTSGRRIHRPWETSLTLRPGPHHRTEWATSAVDAQNHLTVITERTG